ncbi:MAG TPA: ribose 5-phosphate isomerase B [bacterium]|nr:ribose 5-phosphate isomerase B [bacterium]
MRVTIASDHAGFRYKEIFVRELEEQGYEITDLGTHSEESRDYPDVAGELAEFLLEGSADRGVLVCGSGIGMSLAANKFPGIRAAVGHTNYSARQCVEHDDANVICIGERVVGIEVARDIVSTFLHAEFTGEERHRRRVDKIRALEERLRLKPVSRE